jgi:hypothetical protein
MRFVEHAVGEVPNNFLPELYSTLRNVIKVLDKPVYELYNP